MRMPKYLSPSSFHLFQDDREAWAIKYLIDSPREPQTLPMAVGSAFDAAVKSWLYGYFYGENDEWSYPALFAKQVEHEAVYDEGLWLFRCYSDSGALDMLLDEIAESPQMEFTVEANPFGVPLLGKPDLCFLDKLHRKCVYDFKVNGFYSKGITSPGKGYDWLWDSRTCATKSHASQFTMDQVNRKFANQLCIYAWCLGVPVGDESAWLGIEQFTGPKEKLRIARHRSIVPKQYQFDLRDKLLWAWDDIVHGKVMDEGELQLIEESLNAPAS